MIIVGIILIVLQILSLLGNISSGNFVFFHNISNPFVFLYDLIYLIAYFAVGIIGVILLIVGIRRINKNENIPKVDKATNNEQEQEQEHEKEQTLRHKSNTKLSKKAKTILILTAVCFSFLLSAICAYFVFLYDLTWLTAYFAIGIIGVVLLIFGIRGTKKGDIISEGNEPIEKEQQQEQPQPQEQVQLVRHKSNTKSSKKAKTVLILTVVCFGLLLASICAYFVCNSLLESAEEHYYSTISPYSKYSYTIGCDEKMCQYCEGYISNNMFNRTLSINRFDYYKKATVAQNVALGSLVLFAVMTAVGLGLSLYYYQTQEYRTKEKVALHVKSTQIKFCKYCGAQIDSDSIFCSACGKQIKTQ